MDTKRLTSQPGPSTIQLRESTLKAAATRAAPATPLKTTRRALAGMEVDESGIPGSSATIALLVLFFFFAVELLREVVLYPHLVNGVQLAFQPVNVVLLIGQNLVEQLARAVVARGHAQLNAVVEPLHCLVFQLQVVLQLLLHALADIDLEVVAHVGGAVKVQDALDEYFGMPHLLDGFFLGQASQLVIAPVFAHLGVQKILVDGGELRLEHLLQHSDDFRIAFHLPPPALGQHTQALKYIIRPYLIAAPPALWQAP